VLGLLAEGEISGYDLDKRIRHSVGFFWTPVKSHVYTTLARLVESGYASARDVEQAKRSRRSCRSWRRSSAMPIRSATCTGG
jgi:DNA-binding PadR family transcriptional regulator